MSYQEFLPHPALRNYIDAYWTVCIDHVGASGRERILPDCCADLIFNRGNTLYGADQHKTLLSNESYQAGKMTTYRDTYSNPGTSTLGIRFRPGGMVASTTFYGTIEFSIKDLNNYVITFAENPS